MGESSFRSSFLWLAYRLFLVYICFFFPWLSFHFNFHYFSWSDSTINVWKKYKVLNLKRKMCKWCVNQNFFTLNRVEMHIRCISVRTLFIHWCTRYILTSSFYNSSIYVFIFCCSASHDWQSFGVFMMIIAFRDDECCQIRGVLANFIPPIFFHS